MATHPVTKEQIVEILDELPPDSLTEVRQFLNFIRFKNRGATGDSAVTLGGLLAGYEFTEEDIQQARREMWGSLVSDQE